MATGETSRGSNRETSAGGSSGGGLVSSGGQGSGASSGGSHSSSWETLIVRIASGVALAIMIYVAGSVISNERAVARLETRVDAFPKVDESLLRQQAISLDERLVPAVTDISNLRTKMETAMALLAKYEGQINSQCEQGKELRAKVDSLSEALTIARERIARLEAEKSAK